MPKIKIDQNQKYPRLYWPQEFKDGGFVGEVLALGGTFAIVILHPQATLGQAKHSLAIILNDIDLRIQKEKAR